MTVLEIKNAVDSGKTVYFESDNCVVVKGRGGYEIVCRDRKETTSLVWMDGKTLISEESSFFVEEGQQAEDAEMKVEEKTAQIFALLEEVRELKKTFPQLKNGYWLEAGSILNGYREGDLLFNEAKALLLVNKDRGQNHEK